MIPTVSDGLRTDISPCLFGHCHDFQQVDVVDVVLSCLIKFDCTLTKCTSIVCLEAMNDASIEWLYKRDHVWSKRLQADIGRLVEDGMTC
jgi:hypothetical protein